MSSVISNASYQARINYFEERHHHRSRRLRNGRHPRSFKRDGELWSYCQKSSNRVNAIQKGQNFWTVLAQGTKEMQKEIMDLEERMEENHEADPNMAPPEIVIPPLDEFINGYRLDRHTQLTLHYGMSVAIVNQQDGVLCVNKYGDVLVKHITEIGPHDKGCFKLLDIAEPTNPRSVRYGDPLWLQVLDRSHTHDDAWKLGHVLTGKLFGPPNMGNVSIESAGDIDAKKVTEDGGEGAVVVDDFILSSDNKSQALAKKVELQQKRKRTQAENGVGQEKLVLGEHRSGPGAYRHNNMHLNTAQLEREKLFADLMKEKNLAKTMGDLSDARREEEIEQATQMEKQLAQGKEKVAEIVGMAVPTRITGVKVGDEYANADEEVKATRHRSAESSNLGQWSLRSALPKSQDEMVQKELDDGTDELSDMEIVTTEAIYIEQDMYCLSSTQGSDFNVWPRRALNRTVREKKKTIKEDNINMEEADLAAVLTQLTQAGKLQVDKEDDPAEAHRVCLRRLVMRGPPHNFVVDRRSVWRLMIVEAPGDLSSMSVNEISAARVMKHAKDVLAHSSSYRNGGQVYKLKHRPTPAIQEEQEAAVAAATASLSGLSVQDDQDGTSMVSSLGGTSAVASLWRLNAVPGDAVELPPKIRSLQGGEKFPRTLQQVQNKAAFRAEASLLKDRRVKEAYVAEYLLHKVAADVQEETNLMMKKSERLRRKYKKRDNDDSSLIGGSVGQVSMLTEENSYFDMDGNPGSPGSITSSKMGSPGPTVFGEDGGRRNAEEKAKLMLDLDESSTRVYGGTLINLHKQFAMLSKKSEISYKESLKSVAPKLKTAPADEEATEEEILKKKRFDERLAKFREADESMQTSLVHKAHLAKVERITNILG